MSVQYIFWNKCISKKELLEKIPDLRIEHHTPPWGNNYLPF
jgi:hypothetical protein